MYIQREESTPHHTLPHTHACKHTLLCPCQTAALAPCHTRIQSIPCASHCAVHTKHSHPLHIRPPKTHLRPSPLTTTASPHTTHRLMARSLTHYVLQLRQQWHMSQGTCERCTALTTDAVVVQAAMYTPTHNTHCSFITKPTTQHVHTTLTIHASPHTPTHP